MKLQKCENCGIQKYDILMKLIQINGRTYNYCRKCGKLVDDFYKKNASK